ncbi:MAG: hypothetical protein H7Z71_05590 [Moraxellaceae bacterium]|nr:hypothetical protein [Pseudobdellovibrionaceae bacterium]
MKKQKYYTKDDAIKYLVLGGTIVSASGTYNSDDMLYSCKYVEIQNVEPALSELLYRDHETANKYLIEEIGTKILKIKSAIDTIEFVVNVN